jgi:hypothetical protein
MLQQSLTPTAYPALFVNWPVGLAQDWVPENDPVEDVRTRSKSGNAVFQPLSGTAQLPGCRRQLGVALADASAFRRITSI